MTQKNVESDAAKCGRSPHAASLAPFVTHALSLRQARAIYERAQAIVDAAELLVDEGIWIDPAAMMRLREKRQRAKHVLEIVTEREAPGQAGGE